MHLELQLHVEIFEYNYIQLLYNIFILCIYIYILVWDLMIMEDA